MMYTELNWKRGRYSAWLQAANLRLAIQSGRSELAFRGMQLDWLGKAMLGISILTLPHTIVVCLMDRLQSLENRT